MALFQTLVSCLMVQLVQGHNPHDVISAVAASPDGRSVFAIVRRILYRSLDGGLSWEPATSGIVGIDTRADKIFRTIVTSPNFIDDKTVFHTNGAGIFKSTDAGLNWDHIQTESEVDVPEGSSMLVLSHKFRSDQKVLVAATPKGSAKMPMRLLRSDDGGTSFNDVYSFAGKGVFKEISLLATEDVVFAVTESGTIIWSLNFGDDWGSQEFNGAFNSISEIVLDRKSALLPQSARSLEDDWKVGALLMGGHTETSLLVYAYKKGGGAEDFKVLNVQPLQGQAAKESGLVGSAGSTLFFLPSTGGDVYRSENGHQWNARRVIKDRSDLGDWRGQAAALGTGVLSQFVAAASSGHLFIGSYCGLHKSIDGGVNWVKLDVETRRITQLLLTPGSTSSTVQFGTCTYGNGCFGGSLHIDAVKSGGSNTVSDVVHYNEDRYCTMAFSPNYAQDGIVLRRCDVDARSTFSYIRRSEDHGKTFNQVPVPMLGSKKITQDGFPVIGGIFTMAFSPSFAEDGLLFLGGVDVGVAVSKDQGKNFTTLWGAEGKATKVYLSPDFKNDQTLIVLAAQLDHHSGMVFSDFSAWNGNEICISRNGGTTWNINRNKHQLESVYFSPSYAKDKTMIGLRMIEGLTTRLMKSTDAGTSWSDISPGPKGLFQNFGRGGIALAPGGLAMASYLDGGALLGQLPSFLKGDDSPNAVHVSQSTGVVEPFNFVQDTDDDLDVRITGNMVAFSPNYAKDHVIFGCSFYSVFASTDNGKTWRVVWKTGHTDTNCDTDNCEKCHVKDHKECIQCRAGYLPNGVSACERQTRPSLLGVDNSAGRPAQAALASYVEILSILAVVTLAGYAMICRIWAHYACKQHKQDAESRKGAKDVCDTVPFCAAC